MLQVRNAMQTIKVHLNPGTTLHEAAELMIKYGRDALPVLEGDQLVGMVRLADLLTAPLPAHHSPRVPERRGEAELLETWRLLPVRHIMNDQVISVTEDMPLMKAAALLVNNNRQRLPIMRGSKVVGIVSRADIVRTLLTAQRAGAG